MHEQSKLVFDKDSKHVIGKQCDSGKVLNLTSEDIENCNKFRFEYILPDNLDVNSTSLKNVKVAELDDDLEDKKETKEESISDEEELVESDGDDFEEFYEDE